MTNYRAMETQFVACYAVLPHVILNNAKRQADFTTGLPFIILSPAYNKQRQAEASAKKALGESLQIENELEEDDEDEENKQEE